MHYTVADYLIDIVQNSVEAGSSFIEVGICENDKTVSVKVRDNGKGMDSKILKKALDPFYSEGGKHSNRKFGFGLPFLVQAVEVCGGTFNIDSKVGEGTVIEFEFSKENIDSPPLGDIAGAILSMFMFENCREILVKRDVNSKVYSISRGELLDALGDISDVYSISLAKQYLNSQEENLTEQ